MIKKHHGFLILAVVAFMSVEVFSQSEESDEKNSNIKIINSTAETRKSKLFSFLQIIQFPNIACNGTSRMGTCYSRDECVAKKGTSSGSCANGFGVCCVFTLGCGETSAENCTYLVQSSTTSPSPSNCVYTICKCNSKICRIRLDFQTFSIAPPVTGTVVTDPTANTLNGAAVGSCVTDSFVVTAPGNRGSPEICGYNTGQHIYIDASDICSEVNFRFGASSTVTRQYDIKVTQYACQDEIGGPPDCLQYLTSSTGTISSFNFQTNQNAVTSTVTHLRDQFYTICFRRNAGNCAICFAPAIDPAIDTVINQNSFGLSNTAIPSAAGAPIAAPLSAVDTGCSSDYLVIPNAGVLADFTAGIINPGVVHSRYCGRFLNVVNDGTVSATVCTTTRPFKIVFTTDGNELTIATDMASDNEQFGVPGGIIGFSLAYKQIPCSSNMP